MTNKKMVKTHKKRQLPNNEIKESNFAISAKNVFSKQTGHLYKNRLYIQKQFRCFFWIIQPEFLFNNLIYIFAAIFYIY